MPHHLFRCADLLGQWHCGDLANDQEGLPTCRLGESHCIECPILGTTLDNHRSRLSQDARIETGRAPGQLTNLVSLRCAASRKNLVLERVPFGRAINAQEVEQGRVALPAIQTRHFTLKADVPCQPVRVSELVARVLDSWHHISKELSERRKISNGLIAALAGKEAVLSALQYALELLKTTVGLLQARGWTASRLLHRLPPSPQAEPRGIPLSIVTSGEVMAGGEADTGQGLVARVLHTHMNLMEAAHALDAWVRP
mmetsp:Transcript_58848/g.132879  ORF Transcript_58848/g.132879 Transcript_58848/m.132879 type:complete len:256 (+) Transcript_58848:232-999(+)